MPFDMICEVDGIEHRLTKPDHPWTNGQKERMNRKIKDATAKRFQYDQLRAHLTDVMAACNFARRPSEVSLPTNASANSEHQSLVDSS